MLRLLTRAALPKYHPAALALAVGLGCSAGDVPSNLAAELPLVGGVESTLADDAVVLLRNAEGATCSGALIAKNLVVTALSCLAPMPSGRYLCTSQGELENSGSGAGEIGPPFAAEQIEVFIGPTHDLTRPLEPAARGRDLLGTTTTSVCRGNLGLVVLDQHLDGAPILAVRLHGSVEDGAAVSVLGYGAVRAAANRLEWFGTRQRRDDLRVLEAGVPPRSFALGPGPCTGDYGGPALSGETGALVGVYAFGSGPCDAETTRSYFVELPAYRALVLRAFQRAAVEPWLEGEPGPAAEGGRAGEAGGHSTGDGHDNPRGSGDAGADPTHNPSASGGDAGASHAGASSGCALGRAPRGRTFAWVLLLMSSGWLRRRFAFGGRAGW